MDLDFHVARVFEALQVDNYEEAARRIMCCGSALGADYAPDDNARMEAVKDVVFTRIVNINRKRKLADALQELLVKTLAFEARHN